MQAEKVTRKQILRLINDNHGKLMSIQFARTRSDGKYRSFVCRTGVKKYLSGPNSNIGRDSTLLTVYSFTDKGYRSIGHEGILTAQIGGKIYKVVDKRKK